LTSEVALSADVLSVRTLIKLEITAEEGEEPSAEYKVVMKKGVNAE